MVYRASTMHPDPTGKTQINDLLLKIYSGELSLDQGLEDMQKLVDEAKAP